MTILYVILGVVLALLFFLNIKNAADILCRIIGGTTILVAYNLIAYTFSFPAVGVNPFFIVIAGFLGLPGGMLAVFLSFFV